MRAALARGVGGFSGLHVLGLRVHVMPFVVLVVVPDPRHSMFQPRFIAPLRRKVQPVVRTDEDVQPASVARIGVEDIPRSVLVNPASASSFLAFELFLSLFSTTLPFPQP